MKRILILVPGIFALASHDCKAAVITADSASNYVSSGWKTGGAQGFGWTSPWDITGGNGVGLGSSRVNSAGDVSFMFNSPAGFPYVARRVFTPMTQGQTLSFSMDPVSFTSGGQSNIEFDGSDSNLTTAIRAIQADQFYEYETRSGLVSTGIPITKAVDVSITFVDASTNNYRIAFKPLGESEVSFTARMYGGPIWSVDMGAFGSVAAYNNLQITGNSTPEPVSIMSFGLLAALIVRRRKNP